MTEQDEAAVLKARIEERWPSAENVTVTADSSGAVVKMTFRGGEPHTFGISPGGALMRMLLHDSGVTGGSFEGLADGDLHVLAVAYMEAYQEAPEGSEERRAALDAHEAATAALKLRVLLRQEEGA